MVNVTLEAQGKVVLGTLKTLGDSESQRDPAYPDEAGPWNGGKVRHVADLGGKGKTGGAHQVKKGMGWGIGVHGEGS